MSKSGSFSILPFIICAVVVYNVIVDDDETKDTDTSSKTAIEQSDDTKNRLKDATKSIAKGLGEMVETVKESAKDYLEDKKPPEPKEPIAEIPAEKPITITEEQPQELKDDLKDEPDEIKKEPEFKKL